MFEVTLKRSGDGAGLTVIMSDKLADKFIDFIYPDADGAIKDAKGYIELVNFVHKTGMWTEANQEQAEARLKRR